MGRVQTAYKVATKFVMVWQLLVFLLLLLVAPYIADIFTNEKEVADIIVLYIWILPIGYGFQGIIILTNSSFNALHKPMIALLLSIVRLFVCYVPLALLGSYFYGLTGFFVGAVLGNVVMSIFSYNLFIRQFTSIEDQHIESE